MICEFCSNPLPEHEGKGRPSSYCAPEEGEKSSACRRGAEAVAILARVLPGRPGAVVRVLEALEGLDEKLEGVPETDLSRRRAAAFIVAARGRKRGLDGRYTI